MSEKENEYKVEESFLNDVDEILVENSISRIAQIRTQRLVDEEFNAAVLNDSKIHQIIAMRTYIKLAKKKTI